MILLGQNIEIKYDKFQLFTNNLKATTVKFKIY